MRSVLWQKPPFQGCNKSLKNAVKNGIIESREMQYLCVFERFCEMKKKAAFKPYEQHQFYVADRQYTVGYGAKARRDTRKNRRNGERIGREFKIGIMSVSVMILILIKIHFIYRAQTAPKCLFLAFGGRTLIQCFNLGLV